MPETHPTQRDFLAEAVASRASPRDLRAEAAEYRRRGDRNEKAASHRLGAAFAADFAASCRVLGELAHALGDRSPELGAFASELADFAATCEMWADYCRAVDLRAAARARLAEAARHRRRGDLAAAIIAELDAARMDPVSARARRRAGR